MPNEPFCVQHFADNVQRRDGIEVRKKFVGTSYSLTEETRNKTVDELRETHNRALGFSRHLAIYTAGLDRLYENQIRAKTDRTTSFR